MIKIESKNVFTKGLKNLNLGYKSYELKIKSKNFYTKNYGQKNYKSKIKSLKNFDLKNSQNSTIKI